MGHSLFTKLSQVVCARDIQRHLVPPLQSTRSIVEALAHIYEHGFPQIDDVVLVKEGKSFAGWVELAVLHDAWGKPEDPEWPQQWPKLILDKYFYNWRLKCHPLKVGRDAPVEHVMSALHYMSADTPLFDAARTLTDKAPRAVLEGTQVTGTVSYRDLGRMEFQILLFALVLELEKLAHELVMQDHLASWDALADRFKVQAIKRQSKARGERLEESDIRSRYAFAFKPLSGHAWKTTFCVDAATGRKVRVHQGVSANTLLVAFWMQYISLSDKLHIIKRRKLLRGIDTTKIGAITKKTRDLRNDLAHPQTQEWGTCKLVEDGEWWETITDLHKLMASIVRAGNLDEYI